MATETIESLNAQIRRVAMDIDLNSEVSKRLARARLRDLFDRRERVYQEALRRHRAMAERSRTDPKTAG